MRADPAQGIRREDRVFPSAWFGPGLGLLVIAGSVLGMLWWIEQVDLARKRGAATAEPLAETAAAILPDAAAAAPPPAAAASRQAPPRASSVEEGDASQAESDAEPALLSAPFIYVDECDRFGPGTSGYRDCRQREKDRLQETCQRLTEQRPVLRGEAYRAVDMRRQAYCLAYERYRIVGG